METAEDIDRLLLAEKQPVGIARWTSSRETTVRLRLALSIGGEVVGGLFLACDATTHTSRQQGSIVLVYRGMPIERMNVFPPNAHANPMHKSLPRGVRGKLLEPFEHRYYAWQANRRWPRPAGDNLQIAEAVAAKLGDFTAGLEYFCARTHIAGAIPPPPHEPRLEFP